MKIFIDQPEIDEARYLDPFAVAPDAVVTVDLDSGQRVTFQARVKTLLDLDDDSDDDWRTDFRDVGRALAMHARGSGFRVDFDHVTGVEFSQTPKADDDG